MAVNGKLQKRCKCGAILADGIWTRSSLITTIAKAKEAKESSKVLALPEGICWECSDSSFLLGGYMRSMSLLGELTV
jgi:hypothetical protein